MSRSGTGTSAIGDSTRPLPAWVLSLADAEGRRREVERSLANQACLAWRFMDAIDGRGGRPIEAPYDRARTIRWQGFPLTTAEVALVEGHRRMWAAFLEQDQPIGVFFEDDVRCGDRFCESLLGAARHASREWDLLRLECVWPRRVLRAGPEIAAGVRMVIRRHDCRGSAAYALTRSAAERLLRRTLPFWVPMDVIIDRYWDHGLRVRVVDPTPCTQDLSFPSDIGHRDKPRLSLAAKSLRESVRAIDLGRRAAFHLMGGRR